MSILAKDHGELGTALDQPVAALLTDLKSRGLLDETIVHWIRAHALQPRQQRPRSQSAGLHAVLAGGGIKDGVSCGATDEWRLSYRNNGIDRRLTDVHGEVIREIIS